MCSVQCLVCSVQCPVLNVQFAVISLHLVLYCSVQCSALYSNVYCTMSTLCTMQYFAINDSAFVATAHLFGVESIVECKCGQNSEV